LRLALACAGTLLATASAANPALLMVQGTQNQSSALGQTSIKAATSCLAIAQANASRGTGIYWLTTGSAPYLAYCDMTPGDAGWTLVMRAVDSNFVYDDPLWTNTSVSSETVYDFTTTGTSKYEAFNHVAFTYLRSSDTTSWSTSNYTATLAAQTSARSLFSNASGIQLSTTLSTYWNDRTPVAARQWGCTTYVNVGINMFAYLGGAMLPGGGYCDWNGGARFGQRVNGDFSATGNHIGQGWANYGNTATGSYNYTISQLLWVK
jgi:hypothetical protein